MTSRLFSACLVCLCLMTPARAADISGLAPYAWKQTGQKPVSITVSIATAPEWIVTVEEAVSLWQGKPFILSYTIVDGPIPASAVSGIVVSTDPALSASGRTFMQFDKRGLVSGASIQIAPASTFQATAAHDALWYMQHVIRRELGKALGVSENGPHSDSVLDWQGCVMGTQDGNTAGTVFDASLLCQRYACR